MNIHEMVDLIASWLFSDSHVTIDKQSMTEALDKDFAQNGARQLTEAEIELFVCGDDDGEVPEHLMKLYPHVQEQIASYF